MGKLFHGTTKENLEVIKPFKRYTPGGENIADTIPPRIYATKNPAYAVAHSFPWSSDDDVDIVIKDETIILVVPNDRAGMLEQKVCIYTLPDDTFTLTEEEETGLTLHSTETVTPTDCLCFATVFEAMEHLGGKIQLI